MEYFSNGSISEVTVLRLDRGELLLESILEFVRQKGVETCVVLSGIGTLRTCRMNAVTSDAIQPELKHMQIEGALEISALQGIVASGDAHLHVTISDGQQTHAGHLEEGSEVLYLAEVLVAPILGVSLERRPHPGTGVKELKEKEDK